MTGLNILPSCHSEPITKILFTVLKKQTVNGTSSGWNTENMKTFREVDQRVFTFDFVFQIIHYYCAYLWCWHICVRYMCVGTQATVRLWRAEDSLLNSVLSVQFYMGSENQT